MKKSVFYLLIFAALIVTIGSCNKTDELEEWREANTNAYQKITKNPEYKALLTNSGPTGVYYKVIKSGTGSEYPLQTSKVNVLYKGSYYDGTVFDTGTSGNDIPKEIFVLDMSSSSLLPSAKRGFSFVLQNMVIGDKWEIWIPYYLGYGVTGLLDNYYQPIIKGYTTLVYEVELVSITQYP